MRQLIRAVAGALTILFVLSMVAPAPAHSVGTVAVASTGPDLEPHADDDFVVEVFPNTAAQVWFSDSWGARRRGGRRHRGTDIHSPKGTGVVAVAAGRVVEMGWHRLSGWFVVIDHGRGWSTVSMHLNNDTPGTDDGEGGPGHAFAPGLHVGSQVGAGQLIGFVGDSGNAEGAKAHTHFEVQHDGKKLNPYPYLSAAWQLQQRLAVVR